LIICDNIAHLLFTQLNMPEFEVRQTGKLNLASYAGLTLIGQCCELTDALSVRLLERTQAPVSPYRGYVRFEIDTFVMDNSGTRIG
jgi:hypothetical protein